MSRRKWYAMTMDRRANAENAPGRRRASGPLLIRIACARGGWEVRRVGAARAIGTYATEAEAVRAAQAKLETSGGEVRFQGRDGRWKESYTLGGLAMTKLAAVEGITFTPDMKRRIKAALDVSLSKEERRRILRTTVEKARD